MTFVMFMIGYDTVLCYCIVLLYLLLIMSLPAHRKKRAEEQPFNPWGHPGELRCQDRC